MPRYVNKIPVLAMACLLVAALLYVGYQEIEQNEEKTDELDEESEIATLKLKKIRLSGEIANEMEYDLIWAAERYKKLFKKSLPACKQCSELEYLLILERAEKTKNASIEKQINELHNIKNGKIISENELQNIEDEYEKKFSRSIPWWWICSDEERLMRLKKALKTNIPYPDYSSITHYEDGIPYNHGIPYEIGKAMAEYEMRFKKQPPECHCSDGEYLESLQRSLEIGMPYITREEDAELKIKLKTEYKKRFGKEISDLELSTLNVYFRIGGGSISVTRYSTSIMRTATGAIVKGMNEQPETNLDMIEWLDFVNSFYKLIGKWEKRYVKRHVLDGTQWWVNIFFLDEDDKLNFLKFYGSNAYPENWDEFVETMESLGAK